MRNLKDLTIDFLNSKNEELKEIISAKTTAAEEFVREKVVIPYCRKHGYSFVAGMGTWVFSDRDGESFYPGETRHKIRGCPPKGSPGADDDKWYLEPTREDRELKEILGWGFDCMHCSIGSYMKDYAP